MDMTIENFPQFDMGLSSDESLQIPQPAIDGDIRPNPQPVGHIPAVMETKAEDEFMPSSLQVEAVTTAPEDLVPQNVIKDISFHPMPNETPMSALEAEIPEPAVAQDAQQGPATSKIPELNESGFDARTKCFAFMGASGGTGVTTLCVQMAFEMAAKSKSEKRAGGPIDPQVCLIDLDFETGACAAYLDVPPSLHIEDICGSASRIDTSIVQALMSHHESGVAVLSTPNSLGANSLANPETVLALLDAACELYDHVIIDLPRIWQPWIGAAIAGADHFAIVSELTIPSLHMARTRIQNIETVLGNQVQCEVILNKVERRSFRNAIRLSDAEKALQREVSASICIDYETTREAINCGEAVSIIRPEARYVKDVKSLAQTWIPAAQTPRETRKERRRKKRAA